MLNLIKVLILFALRDISAYEFSNDLTFYGGAGSGGSCSSSYVPEGFTTVAMNNDQYDGGMVCGSCLKGVYHPPGGSVYFDAIVDNKCPECVFGDLDLGEVGDGRWDVEWSFSECPKIESLIVTSQGSNSFYGKIKFEGGGSISTVKINGMDTVPTDDGFFVIEDTSGSLGCGPMADVVTSYGKTHKMCLDPELFGGDCSGEKCSVESEQDEVDEQDDVDEQDE